MSTRNWRRLLIVGAFASGVTLALILSGCSSGPQIAPHKTHEQIWIDAHPTHAGPNGECVEFDGEPCDADPHDLDDLREARVHRSPSPSPKVVKPSSKPAVKPSPKRTR